MTQPGHLAGGYLATTALLNIAHLSITSHQINIAIIVGLATAIMPDLDLVYFYAKKKKGGPKEGIIHRTFISHAPVVWIFSGLIFYFTSFTDFSRAIALAVIAGSVSHFILDSIEDGIMWLWPFSNKLFALHQTKITEPEESNILKYYWKLFSEVYVQKLTFLFEIIIVLTGLYVFFK